MEAARVCWKSGRADPASGETHAQALIPLSHTGREQQAPPSGEMGPEVNLSPSWRPGYTVALRRQSGNTFHTKKSHVQKRLQGLQLLQCTFTTFMAFISTAYIQLRS